jgi:hypothetical protein
LEEEAEEILHEFAKSQGKSLRKLGILDTRRIKVVNRREIPMTVLQDNMAKKHKGD